MHERPSTIDGMSCTSEPPRATFNTCIPRQMASSGSPSRSAAWITANSSVSRASETPMMLS